MLRRWLPVYGLIIIVVWAFALGRGVLLAESTPPQLAQGVTPTPDRVEIPTSTLPPSPTTFETAVPPTFTPTNQGIPQIVVPAGSGDINARAEASDTSQVLGQISAGEQYEITGRYFRWIQFRYEENLAFVYDGLVDIIGDPALIVDLTQQQQPTAAGQNETATALVLQQTPGWDLTQTAQVREIAAPDGSVSSGDAGNESGNASGANGAAQGGVQPTFTYPFTPQLPTIGPFTQATLMPETTGLAIGVSEGIAPIVPIVGLISLGLIGLMLSTLRR